MIVMFALLLSAATAHAHAYLDRAEPRVGSSVSSPPRQLSLADADALPLLAETGADVADFHVAECNRHSPLPSRLDHRLYLHVQWRYRPRARFVQWR